MMTRIAAFVLLQLMAFAISAATRAQSAVVEVAEGVTVVRSQPAGPAAVLVELDNGLLLVDGSTLSPQAIAALGIDDVRWRVETSAATRGADHSFPDAPQIAPVGSSGVAVSFHDRLGIGDEVEVVALGRAISESDIAVHIRDRGVLLVGALADEPPSVAADSDLAGWIESLARLERIDAGTVVPARGGVGGTELLRQRRLMLEALRGDVWNDLKAGRPWPEILIEGRETSPAALVELVYGELAGTIPPRELLVERGLREGPSPTRDDPDWKPPTKVLWRNRWPNRFASLQAVAPGVEIVAVTTADEAVAAVADADAVIGILTPEIARAGERLRWAQVTSAGVERYVGIPELADRNIVLTNGQRLASPEIAEHAMALVRALARRLDRAAAAQADRTWSRSEYRGDGDLLRLRGKTLLVAGLGGIGSEVARLADGAGMTVLATRASRRSGPTFVAEIGLDEDLEAMLERADVVVDCLPLTDTTRGRFNRELFRIMPPHALFVNVGRGGTVVTDDLVAALEEGDIGGAGLDVTDPEPLPDDHPLWQAPNIIITPHSAAISDADRERQWLLMRENLRRFVAGEPLLSVVDLDRGVLNRTADVGSNEALELGAPSHPPSE